MHEITYYFLSVIFFSSILMILPRLAACSKVRTLARRSSLNSSRCPSRPALKNTCNAETQTGWFRQFCLLLRVAPLIDVPLLEAQSNKHFYWSLTCLSMPKSILIMVDIQWSQQFLCSLPAVHKLVIRDSVRIQNAIPSKWRNLHILIVYSYSLFSSSYSVHCFDWIFINWLIKLTSYKPLNVKGVQFYNVKILLLWRHCYK